MGEYPRPDGLPMSQSADEEFRRLKAYDRLNAIADVLTISVVMVFSYFLPTPLFYQVAIYGLAVLMAIVSLLWHTLVPDRYLSRTKLFIKYALDTVFVTLLIQYTGEVQSPFFFLYYLILLAMALSIGVRSTLLLAGVMTAGYLMMSGVALNRLILDPKSFIYVWANIVSLWLVAYLAAVLAHEAERARRSVEDAKNQIESYSKIDWLTGLFNMRQFDTYAAQELARSDRYGRPFSLLIVDSDNLKLVNDTLGHPAGDRHIVDLARTISRLTRASDTAIRYGGDEFIVILPETDTIGARLLAERIRAAVEARGMTINGQTVPTSVSIGIASYPRDAADPLGLLARADAALYRAKQAGRNQVAVYSADVDVVPLMDGLTPFSQPLPRAR